MTKPKPTPLNYYIGQNTAKSVVEDAVAVFRKTQSPIPTYLLDWPPGHGKNEFHAAIAGTMGVLPTVFKVADGVRALGEKLWTTHKMTPNALFLLNEVQSAKAKRMVDPILDLLETRTFTYQDGTILNVNQMSFMLATTEGWKIPQDIRSRVTAELPFIPYSDDEMVLILRQFMPTDVKIPDDLMADLVRISLFEPRMARHIAVTVTQKIELGTEVSVTSVCSSLGLSHDGLTIQDRQILEFVSQSFRGAPRHASSSDISTFIRQPVQAVPRYMERLRRLGYVMQDAAYIWRIPN